MAYSHLRDQALLIGGTDGNTTNDETWGFDGRDWQRLVLAGTPRHRRYAALAEYEVLGLMVLVGGATQTAQVSDPRGFDGAVWRALPEVIAAPTGRGSLSLAYHQSSQELVLFGGSVGGDETWLLSWRGLGESEVCRPGPDVDDDNDGDQLVDCRDPDCALHPNCASDPPCPTVDCTNPGCGGAVCGYLSRRCVAGRCVCPGGYTEEPICDDGVDNDCDGLVDCADPDCAERAPPETRCDDGVDNDCDGLVDCWDPDCWLLEPCFSGGR